MRRRNLKCNEGIFEINNNAVKFSGLEIKHVALFSSCSPLIFFHADKTTELAATIISVMILRAAYIQIQLTCKGHQGRLL